jgi:hypothetical protein
MSEKPQVGIALLLNFFLGLVGADKFYIGRPDLGILQIVLTVTFIGLIINIPWVLLCTISLFVAIFLGGIPFMYPGVDWAEITNRDKIIALVLLIFLLISYMLRRPKLIQNYQDTSPTKAYSKCSSKENYSNCSGCSGDRLLGPYDTYDDKRNKRNPYS